MIKKAFAIVGIPFLPLGFSALASAEGKEGTGGKAAPVITQSFASKEVRPGQNWNVYLNISDPEGNMKSIFAVVDQLGVGEYPVSIIRVKKRDYKELSGYLYLCTAAPGFSGQFVKLTFNCSRPGQVGEFQPASGIPFVYTPASHAGDTSPRGI